MTTTCTFDGCTRDVLAKGLCASHYNSERAKARRAAIRAVDRPCAQCGGSLAGKRPNAKFCSQQCKQASASEASKAEYRRRRSGQVCRWCGGPIPADAGSRALTCSRRCGEAWQNHVASANARKRAARRAAWDANRPHCIGCGVRIPDDRRVGVKFCSEDCKKRTQDARWRAKSPGYNRQYLYGMTEEQYAAMLDAQGGGCAICRTTEWNGRHPVPHVDHDHRTGEVRGILCHACNLGLGKFKDDPDLLRAAIAYLTR